MTTTYTTPGRFASTDRAYQLRQLPALFNDGWLDTLFGEVNKAFDVPNACYPYNVIAVKDSQQEITHYEVEVALAGVGKENIDVKVRDGKLQINVLYAKGTPAEDSVSRTFLKKGISERKGNIIFNLDERVNAKAISSSYTNGLLKVIVPIVQPESINIDVAVV